MTARDDRLLESESVTVVGVEDPPTSRPSPSSTRTLRWVGTLLAVALAVLLLLPRDDPPPGYTLAEGELDVPSDERLLPWPGRGPWAADQSFVAEASTAWRDAAIVDSSVDAPGDDVVALWAGPVLDARMAVLQSVGADGVVRVAQVSDMLFGWLQPQLRLLGTDRVTTEPPFLVFPFVGPDDRRGQLDPDVLATFQMLPGPQVRSGEHSALRVDGSRLVSVDVQPDGLSAPWAYGRWWIREDPEVAVVTRADDGALEAAVRLGPDALVPGDPPVSLVDPLWGADRPYVAQDYVTASAALEALGADSGAASVLGTAETPAGPASLVHAQSTSHGAAVLVVGGGAQPETSSAASVGPASQVALGVARRPTGERVVVAAASPLTTLLAIDADGDALTTGGRAQAAVLPPDADVAVVEARAFLADDTVLERARLDLPGELRER